MRLQETLDDALPGVDRIADSMNEVFDRYKDFGLNILRLRRASSLPGSSKGPDLSALESGLNIGAHGLLASDGEPQGV